MGLDSRHPFLFPFTIDRDYISCDFRGSVVQQFLRGDTTTVVVSLIKKQETKWWTERENIQSVVIDTLSRGVLGYP